MIALISANAVAALINISHTETPSVLLLFREGAGDHGVGRDHLLAGDGREGTVLPKSNFAAARVVPRSS